MPDSKKLLAALIVGMVGGNWLRMRGLGCEQHALLLVQRLQPELKIYVSLFLASIDIYLNFERKKAKSSAENENVLNHGFL